MLEKDKKRSKELKAPKKRQRSVQFRADQGHRFRGDQLYSSLEVKGCPLTTPNRRPCRHTRRCHRISAGPEQERRVVPPCLQSLSSWPHTGSALKPGKPGHKETYFPPFVSQGKNDVYKGLRTQKGTMRFATPGRNAKQQPKQRTKHYRFPPFLFFSH